MSTLCRTIAFTVALTAVVFLPTARSAATLEDSPKALVDEAWQVINRDYVDRTFNQHDWLQVRQDYLKRSYTSTQQAYQAIQEMLQQLDDPYTEFLTQTQIKDLLNNVSGDFVGVGLTVALDEQTREWVVVAPLKGSPAAAAGILPEDVITRINGRKTAEIDPSKASKYLIGPVGSPVGLTLRRQSQELNFKLLREQIDLSPITYRVEKTPAGAIGYIRLPVFTSKSPQGVATALRSLEQQNVTGYILDLRSNPGGVLDASVEIARMWLAKGTLVSVVDRQDQKSRFVAHQQALTNKPLQVLVDKNSASASEILAGALQDNRRAQLVGSRTFGKGLVQSLAELQDGSGVKITVARYYTPKGRNINEIGIEPDVVVPISDQQWADLVQNQAVGTAADPVYTRALENLTRSRLTPASRPSRPK